MINIIKERIALLSSFRRVFDSPDGKRALTTILKEGFIFKTTFVAGDPYQTALNEGSRRLALSILRLVYKDEGEMVKELEKLQQER